MKVNFTQFPIYTKIKKDMKVACNVVDPLANGIYKNVAGLQAHLLSEKIYQSTGEMELNDGEVEIINKVSECFPGAFADSLTDYIKDYKETEQEETV